jgi:hypothetical protein
VPVSISWIGHRVDERSFVPNSIPPYPRFARKQKMKRIRRPRLADPKVAKMVRHLAATGERHDSELVEPIDFLVTAPMNI